MEGSIMSKWYRKTVTKAALLIAGVITGALIGIVCREVLKRIGNITFT